MAASRICALAMKNEKLGRMSQRPGSHLTMDTHTDAAMQEGINNDGSETCDEAEEACSSNIVGANNDDASDIIKKDLESSTAEEESYVEGSDCRNNDADQEATTDRVSRSDAGISRDLDNDLESESNRNGPLPEVQEDMLSSNSTSNNSAFLAVLRSEEEKQEEVERQGNTIDRLSRQDASSNEHEESRARVLNPSTDPGGEQIVPRNRKMPALSEKQQIQTLGPVGAFAEGQGEHSDRQVGTSPAASKRSYHTLAPANGVAACQQAGAFREDRVEQSGLQVGTTRLPGASKPSRGLEEDTSGNEQDEESAVMIIHATLVVEEGSETRRQDSYSSSTIEVRSNNDIAVEDGSATGRENRHSPSTRDERSNVNDDIAASYINSNVVVENVIMDEHLAEHPRNPELVEATLLNDQKTTIWCQHRKTWIFAVGVVAVLAIIISIAVVFGVNSSDDKEVGNTMESFVRDVLPGFSQSELEDPTSDQSLALAWLWKDPNATSRLPNFRRVQRFALATAFFAMANSIDQENIERTTWLTEDHECTWQTNDSPITVCDNEEFETFSVSEFALNGTIPPEIGLLTKLVSIDISDNHVYGTLPSELGYLSRMDQFMATNCALVSHYTYYMRYSMSTSFSPGACRPD